MSRDQDSEFRDKLVPTAEMRRWLDERVDTYHKQLRSDSVGLEYLRSRNFEDSVADDFRIGYVDDPLPGDSWYRGCLSIPYLSPSGVVSIKFRSLNGGQKYRYDPGQIHRIYNTPVLVKARKVVITEGELDCLSLVSAGLQAVGVPGATSWKRPWTRVFRNREVTIFCDGDEPGREMGRKLTSLIFGARMIEAPEGEDANSLLQQYGPDYLRDMVLG